jgi:hypothetical protein
VASGAGYQVQIAGSSGHASNVSVTSGAPVHGVGSGSPVDSEPVAESVPSLVDEGPSVVVDPAVESATPAVEPALVPSLDALDPLVADSVVDPSLGTQLPDTSPAWSLNRRPDGHDASGKEQ